MNKTITIVIVALIILFGAGAFVFLSNDSDDSSSNNSSEMMKEDAVEKDSDTMKAEGEDHMIEGDGAMMESTNTYITLAEYEANEDAYKDKTKVHFFHASWCPTCQAIEKDINSDPSQIPSSAVFIKTDFDSETNLRQKYGVTTQYTFVQIDNDGNEVAQWTATNLNKAIAGII